MTFGYHFSTNDQITKVNLPPKVRNCNDLPAAILGPEYEDQDSMYMVSLPDDYFLMMHEDNDFEKNYKKSKLPINKALRKYFPNSPYKGNVVLVRVDEDDLLKGGKWTDAVLRKFQMGYIEGRAVNEPTIISKDDEGYDFSKVPIPEKTLKAPKPTALKICDQCGFPKTIFHYEECLLNQTKAIVDKVAAIRREHKDLDEYLIEASQPLIEEEGSWKKVTLCKALLGKGLNQSGIRWCNFYLDLFAKKENPIEQRTILSGLTSLLYCYDFNSRLNFSLSECPQCEKDHDECLKQRTSDTKLICRTLKTMNFSRASDLRKVDLYHLSINVFNQFLTQLSKEDDEGVPDELEATMLVSMTFSWAIVLLEEHNFMNLMNEVDRELF